MCAQRDRSLVYHHFHSPCPLLTEFREEDDGEVMVFQMIDGKEREGIMEWVRRHRSLFEIATAQGAGVGSSGSEVIELDPK